MQKRVQPTLSSNKVPSCTESDLTDVKIIEDLNPPIEPDIIDLTNLDDKKECDSGELEKLNKNKKATFTHK